MKNMRKPIKQNEVLEIITSHLAGLLSKGYVVQSCHSSNDLPQFSLIRDSKCIQLTSKITHKSLPFVSNLPYKHGHDVLTIYLTTENETKILNTFYEINFQLYVRTQWELDTIVQKRTTRYQSKRLNNTEREIKSKKAIDFVKTLKGFRSVPKKNIKIVRLHDYKYVIMNVANERNRKVVSR